MGTVSFDQRDRPLVFIELDGASSTTVIGTPEAVTLVSQHVEIGDAVRHLANREQVGSVLAIADGLLWVKLKNGFCATWAAENVEVVSTIPADVDAVPEVSASAS